MQLLNICFIKSFTHEMHFSDKLHEQAYVNIIDI